MVYRIHFEQLKSIDIPISYPINPEIFIENYPPSDYSPILSSNTQTDLMTSVWLYSTEKGRESKKRPYKYWMNNTEMYFEVYFPHPTLHNSDVGLLLEMTYKSFIQSARIYSYENEKKNTTPITNIASAVFSNPMVDDIRLVTLTNYGWRIPFRCNISLPIDKVRYIKLYIQNSFIEFGLYSKASSKNKLDAGTPILFPLLRKFITIPNIDFISFHSYFIRSRFHNPVQLLPKKEIISTPSLKF